MRQLRLTSALGNVHLKPWDAHADCINNPKPPQPQLTREPCQGPCLPNLLKLMHSASGVLSAPLWLLSECRSSICSSLFTHYAALFAWTLFGTRLTVWQPADIKGIHQLSTSSTLHLFVLENRKHLYEPLSIREIEKACAISHLATINACAVANHSNFRYPPLAIGIAYRNHGPRRCEL